ncbi:Ankyrin repeat-containing domain [Trinorchestia longiramus]|nr:Ankyrin repeat-containing domain [Trinorchestia longiramus]
MPVLYRWRHAVALACANTQRCSCVAALQLRDMKKLRKVLGSVTQLSGGRTPHSPTPGSHTAGATGSQYPTIVVQTGSPLRRDDAPAAGGSGYQGTPAGGDASYHSYKTASLDSLGRVSGRTKTEKSYPEVFHMDNFENKLLKAAYEGDVVKLKKRLKTVPVNSVDSHGRSALHVAAARSHVQSVKLLLSSEATVDALDASGASALVAAVKSGRVAAVVALIDHGASISIQDTLGNSALHYACLLAASPVAEAILASLLKMDQSATASSVIDMVNRDGNTALHLAAAKANLTACVRLLEGGCHVNCSNKENVTPLMMAAQSGNVTLIDCLLNYSADAFLKDQLGRTAAQLAYAAGDEYSFRMLQRACAVGDGEYSGYGGGEMVFTSATAVRDNRKKSLIPAELLGSTDSDDASQEALDTNLHDGSDDSWADHSGSSIEQAKPSLAKFLLPSSSEEEDAGLDEDRHCNNTSDSVCSAASKPQKDHTGNPSLVCGEHTPSPGSHASRSKGSGSASLLASSRTVKENVTSGEASRLRRQSQVTLQGSDSLLGNNGGWDGESTLRVSSESRSRVRSKFSDVLREPDNVSTSSETRELAAPDGELGPDETNDDVDRKDSSSSGSWNNPTESVSLKLFGERSHLSIDDGLEDKTVSTAFTGSRKQDISACYTQSVSQLGKGSFDQDLESLDCTSSKADNNGTEVEKSCDIEHSEGVSFSRDDSSEILPLETSNVHACDVSTPQRARRPFKKAVRSISPDDFLNDSWSVSGSKGDSTVNSKNSGTPEPYQEILPESLERDQNEAIKSERESGSKATNTGDKQKSSEQDCDSDNSEANNRSAREMLDRRDTLMGVEEIWEANASLDLLDLRARDHELNVRLEDANNSAVRTSNLSAADERGEPEIKSSSPDCTRRHSVLPEGVTLSPIRRPQSGLDTSSRNGGAGEGVMQDRPPTPSSSLADFSMEENNGKNSLADPSDNDDHGSLRDELSRSRFDDIKVKRTKVGVVLRGGSPRNLKLLRKNSISFGELFTNSSRHKLKRSSSHLSISSIHEEGLQKLTQVALKNEEKHKLSKGKRQTLKLDQKSEGSRQSSDDEGLFSTDTEESMHFVAHPETMNLMTPLSQVEGVVDLPENISNLIRETRLQLEKQMLKRETERNQLKLLMLNHSQLIQHSRELEKQNLELVRQTEKCKVAAKYLKFRHSNDGRDVEFYRSTTEKLREVLLSVQDARGFEAKDSFRASQHLAQLEKACDVLLKIAAHQERVLQYRPQGLATTRTASGPSLRPSQTEDEDGTEGRAFTSLHRDGESHILLDQVPGRLAGTSVVKTTEEIVTCTTGVQTRAFEEPSTIEKSSVEVQTNLMPELMGVETSSVEIQTQFMQASMAVETQTQSAGEAQRESWSIRTSTAEVQTDSVQDTKRAEVSTAEMQTEHAESKKEFMSTGTSSTDLPTHLHGNAICVESQCVGVQVNVSSNHHSNSRSVLQQTELFAGTESKLIQTDSVLLNTKQNEEQAAVITSVETCEASVQVAQTISTVNTQTHTHEQTNSKSVQCNSCSTYSKDTQTTFDDHVPSCSVMTTRIEVTDETMQVYPTDLALVLDAAIQATAAQASAAEVVRVDVVDVSTDAQVDVADVSTDAQVDVADVSTAAQVDVADVSTAAQVDMVDVSTGAQVDVADVFTDAHVDVADVSTTIQVNVADFQIQTDFSLSMPTDAAEVHVSERKAATVMAETNTFTATREVMVQTNNTNLNLVDSLTQTSDLCDLSVDASMQTDDTSPHFTETPVQTTGVQVVHGSVQTMSVDAETLNGTTQTNISCLKAVDENIQTNLTFWDVQNVSVQTARVPAYALSYETDTSASYAACGGEDADHRTEEEEMCFGNSVAVLENTGKQSAEHASRSKCKHVQIQTHDTEIQLSASIHEVKEPVKNAFSQTQLLGIPSENNLRNTLNSSPTVSEACLYQPIINALNVATQTERCRFRNLRRSSPSIEGARKIRGSRSLDSINQNNSKSLSITHEPQLDLHHLSKDSVFITFSGSRSPSPIQSSRSEGDCPSPGTDHFLTSTKLHSPEVLLNDSHVNPSRKIIAHGRSFTGSVDHIDFVRNTPHVGGSFSRNWPDAPVNNTLMNKLYEIEQEILKKFSESLAFHELSEMRVRNYREQVEEIRDNVDHMNSDLNRSLSEIKDTIQNNISNPDTYYQRKCLEENMRELKIQFNSKLEDLKRSVGLQQAQCLAHLDNTILTKLKQLKFSEKFERVQDDMRGQLRDMNLIMLNRIKNSDRIIEEIITTNLEKEMKKALFPLEDSVKQLHTFMQVAGEKLNSELKTSVTDTIDGLHENNAQFERNLKDKVTNTQLMLSEVIEENFQIMRHQIQKQQDTLLKRLNEVTSAIQSLEAFSSTTVEIAAKIIEVKDLVLTATVDRAQMTLLFQENESLKCQLENERLQTCATCRASTAMSDYKSSADLAAENQALSVELAVAKEKSILLIERVHDKEEEIKRTFELVKIHPGVCSTVNNIQKSHDDRKDDFRVDFVTPQMKAASGVKHLSSSRQQSALTNQSSVLPSNLISTRQNAGPVLQSSELSAVTGNEASEATASRLGNEKTAFVSPQECRALNDLEVRLQEAEISRKALEAKNVQMQSRVAYLDDLLKAEHQKVSQQQPEIEAYNETISALRQENVKLNKQCLETIALHTELHKMSLEKEKKEMDLKNMTMRLHQVESVVNAGQNQLHQMRCKLRIMEKMKQEVENENSELTFAVESLEQKLKRKDRSIIQERKITEGQRMAAEEKDMLLRERCAQIKRLEGAKVALDEKVRETQEQVHCVRRLAEEKDEVIQDLDRTVTDVKVQLRTAIRTQQVLAEKNEHFQKEKYDLLTELEALKAEKQRLEDNFTQNQVKNHEEFLVLQEGYRKLEEEIASDYVPRVVFDNITQSVEEKYVSKIKCTKAEVGCLRDVNKQLQEEQNVTIRKLGKEISNWKEECRRLKSQNTQGEYTQNINMDRQANHARNVALENVNSNPGLSQQRARRKQHRRAGGGGDIGQPHTTAHSENLSANSINEPDQQKWKRKSSVNEAGNDDYNAASIDNLRSVVANTSFSVSLPRSFHARPQHASRQTSRLDSVLSSFPRTASAPRYNHTEELEATLRKTYSEAKGATSPPDRTATWTSPENYGYAQLTFK